MKKRLLYAILLVTLSAYGQSEKESFDKFRQEIQGNYNSFRKSILDDYSSFLSQAWKEFEIFKGIERDPKPKPEEQPRVPETPTKIPQDKPVVQTPVILTPNVPEEKTEPSQPIIPAKPAIPTKPVAPAKEFVSFNLYGANLKLPKVNATTVGGFDEKLIAKAWGGWHNKRIASDLKPYVDIIKNTYGLNDWLTVEAVRAYADQLFINATSTDRIAFTHYLLTSLGYDVRLARSNRQLILAVCFEQMVYARSFIEIDGKKYHVFYDNVSPIDEGAHPFYTCSLPADSDHGKKVDLIINSNLSIASKGTTHTFKLSDGKLSVTGEVPLGLMKIFEQYPQMPVPCYASSSIMKELRRDIISQLKPQIAGMTNEQAINALLHFVQYSFKYATDDEQFGYEKPFFIEEIFYYPKCDCEDRAIFFSYLVRHLLDIDVHLIHYPGHECSAVNTTINTTGGSTSYLYSGKKYFIADPTYYGATIGMCMKQYLDTQPEIELW